MGGTLAGRGLFILVGNLLFLFVSQFEVFKLDVLVVSPELLEAIVVGGMGWYLVVFLRAGWY